VNRGPDQRIIVISFPGRYHRKQSVLLPKGRISKIAGRFPGADLSRLFHPCLELLIILPYLHADDNRVAGCRVLRDNQSAIAEISVLLIPSIRADRSSQRSASCPGQHEENPVRAHCCTPQHGRKKIRAGLKNGFRHRKP
jgi:hypothetical protein